jgi:hypothetical protein
MDITIHYMTGLFDYLLRTILNGLVMFDWFEVTYEKIYAAISLIPDLRHAFYFTMGYNPFILFLDTQDYYLRNTIKGS